jgi:hypothetical protein
VTEIEKKLVKSKWKKKYATEVSVSRKEGDNSSEGDKIFTANDSKVLAFCLSAIKPEIGVSKSI